MKKPSHHRLNTSEEDRRRLADWLAERRMDRLMRGGADESESRPEPSPAGTLIRYDQRVGARQLKPGAIHILRPVAASNQVFGPVYVLLVEFVDGVSGGWRMMPFGRYAEPAVPGEWATGQTWAPLRVLCLWNDRVVDPDRLIPEPAGRFGPAIMRRVLAIRRFMHEGGVLASRDRRTLGPPLFHPADPRHAYLDEEVERLDIHVGRHPAQERTVVDSEAVAWRLAAEGRPGYGTEPEV